MPVNLIHLQSFIEIARARSITAAAKKLYMNPSSLLQQMNLFEEELGFKALVRSKRGCNLTEAGALLYEEGLQILDAADSLLDRCRDIAKTAERTISAALIPPFAAVAFLDAFCEASPDVSFDLVTPSSLERDRAFPLVLSGEIDLLEYGAIDFTPYEGVEFFEYDRHRMCCACRPGHPFAHKDSVALEDLEGFSISLCKNGSDINKAIVDYIDKHDLGIQVSKVEFSNAAVMKGCEGNGMFVMSSQQQHLFEHLRFVPLTPDFWYRHSLVYATECKPIVRKFVEFARTRARYAQ